jgi:hypothetical protein
MIRDDYYRDVCPRIGKLNVLLKLYDLGEITVGMTADYRQQFTHRIGAPEHENYTVRWTLDSIEHHVNLLIGIKQRRIASGE